MYMKLVWITHRGFTLIELMVGILIFSIGMTAIFALIQLAINSSGRIRQEVIASNLMREQIELVKNIRDTNIRNFIPWDSTLLEGVTSSFFWSGYYVIENDFSASKVKINPVSWSIEDSPVYMKEVVLSASNDLKAIFDRTRLYKDTLGRYTHTDTGIGTAFSSYIIVSPLEIPTTPPTLLYTPPGANSRLKSQAYKIRARVIVSDPKLREYELNTIITDWQK